ncbi:MAG: DUF5615 family PIN-like protein [Nitrospira sp.]|jgi:hypothetical protein|nr:DUF5615 family PIN-like protein [Nitrospira sp.]
MKFLVDANLPPGLAAWLQERNHEAIHVNDQIGLASGYHDILKRGFPCPENERTILAELHSPNVPDFLYGGCGDVPFPRLRTCARCIRNSPRQRNRVCFRACSQDGKNEAVRLDQSSMQ